MKIPYQQEIVEDPAQFKAIRGGRRVGKTYTLALEIKARLDTEDIGVFVAHEGIGRILRTELTAETIKTMNIEIISNPKLNHGKIYDLIVVDEAGYMNDDFLHELYFMAKMYGSDFVMAGCPPVYPNSAFQELAESDEFKQWHLPSHLGPFWSEELKQELQTTYNNKEYALEILAKWPDDVEA